MEIALPHTDAADALAAQTTRTRLILAAMELFAEHGVEGASLRRINELAECRNSSAVHYHFGNRNKLIGAVLEFIGSRWDVQSLAERRLPNATELLRVVAWSLLELHNGAPWGPNALRFMQRLVMDRDPDVRALWRLHFAKHLEPLAEELTRMYPNLPADTLRLRLILTVVSLLHSVAGLDALHRTALGNVRGTRTDEQMLEEFVAFTAGGLLAPEAA